MKRSQYRVFLLALATLAFLYAMSAGARSQDVTHPSTTEVTGPEEHAISQTTITNAKVIHVSGNEILVELESGRLELLRLPEDFKLNVDGKEMTAGELTPGTMLTQEIHTVRTPQEVTTVRTVNGKVWHVMGRSLILAFPNGEHKKYMVPADIVFNINGEKLTVFELKKGMEISGTVVTVAPSELISTHTVITGQAPELNVPFEGPLLLEPMTEAAPSTAMTAMEEPAQELPKTASDWPLAGLLGFLFLMIYASMRGTRRSEP